MEIVPYQKKHSKAVKMIAQQAFNDEQAIKGFGKGQNISLVAIDGGCVVGLIGAVPQYKNTGWELHPLAVEEGHRFQGCGTALVVALECEVAKRGGVMIYLGSDDEDGKTSLSGVDLYNDTFQKIAEIKNINNHPYEFYQRQGYKIVGVFPDANGIGKPDIWLAKKIAK